MKNLIPIEDFLNEAEDPNTPNISVLDILAGQKCRDVFSWYIATLPFLGKREEAIADAIISNIDDPDFVSNWQKEPGEKDPQMLDALIDGIGKADINGNYSEEEVGEQWFNGEQYSNFLDDYVHVYEHADVEEEGPTSVYYLDPLQFIKFVTERNTPFIQKFLGPNCLDIIKVSVDKGVPLDYKTILENAEIWKSGSTKAILGDIDPIRIKNLTKAYNLLQRKTN